MNNIVKEVLKKIEDSGHKAYLVGGYTRDFLLDKNNDDYDICTSAKKEELENIFDIPLVENYGSIILIYKDLKFEITTFRKETMYQGIRTPNIEYTELLEEDIKRRDFTINTICMDSKGEIIDLLNGQNDLKSKTIRCVGPIEKKMIEDPLRILRAIRFACILDFEIEPELSNFIMDNSHLVEKLSFFRKKQELDKIFNSENCIYGLSLLKKYRLLKYLDLKAGKVKGTNSYLGIWAQFEYSDEYPFTSKEHKCIESIKNIVNQKAVTDFDLYNYGLETSLIASQILNLNCDDINKRYKELIIKNKKEINITSEEILKLTKLKISFIYKVLENKILSKELKNDKEDIIEFIKKLNINDIDK